MMNKKKKKNSPDAEKIRKTLEKYRTNKEDIYE